MIKDIFYFSKPDRAATLVLLVIIIVTTVLKYYISSGKNSFEQDRMADSINSITQTLSPDTVLTQQNDTIRRPSNRRNDDRKKSAFPVSSGSVRTFYGSKLSPEFNNGSCLIEIDVWVTA